MKVDVYFDKPMHRDAKVLMSTQTLQPGERWLVEFTPEEVETYMDPLWREAVVRIESEALVCHKGSFDVGDDKRFGTVKIVERWEMDPAEEGHPALGETFPSISIEGVDSNEKVLPGESVASYFVFFGWDCAAMWPQLLDLSWALGQSLVPGQVLPLALSRGTASDSLVLGQRWRVENVIAGVYNQNYGGVIAPEGMISHGSDLYTKAFFIGDIPGGAEHPTDYLVGTDGRVFGVDKVYRGLWPLRVSSPED